MILLLGLCAMYWVAQGLFFLVRLLTPVDVPTLTTKLVGNRPVRITMYLPVAGSRPVPSGPAILLNKPTDPRTN
jgi:hypothetical protein